MCKKKTPNDPDGHFVLGVSLSRRPGTPIQAAGQFKAVSKMLPKDGVSQQMAALLSPSDRQPPAETSKADLRRRVPSHNRRQPPNVVGKWSAAAGGGEVALSLSGDGKFKWTHCARGKIEMVRGDLSACRCNAGDGVQQRRIDGRQGAGRRRQAILVQNGRRSRERSGARVQQVMAVI